MIFLDDVDLARLRRMWRQRRDAAGPMRSRIRTDGMTRPPRSPEEREWLEGRGERSPFVEVEAPPARTRKLTPRGS